MKKITSPFEVKNHAIACKVLGIDPKKVTNVHDQQDNIAKAINKLDKFKPSFKNGEQQKWTPYFWVDASDFRFDCSYYDYEDSHAKVGSRLCMRFRSREISDFYANQHFALHKKAYYK